MEKNEQEIINYKRKYQKSLKKYIAMMHMAHLFMLPTEEQAKLFSILDEPELDDFDFDKILDRDDHIKAIFATCPYHDFCEEYPKALVEARGNIKVMCN